MAGDVRPATPVRSFRVPDLTTVPWRTYPAASIAGWLQEVYGQLAVTAGAAKPTIAALRERLDDVDFTGDRDAHLRWSAAVDQIAAVLAAAGVVDTAAASTATLDFAQLEQFHAPAFPGASSDELDAAFAHGPPLPDPDLHQALAFVGRHPRLQRWLGLVHDLEVPDPVGGTATVQVRVEPLWEPTVTSLVQSTPWTACDVGAGFTAHPLDPQAMQDGHLASTCRPGTGRSGSTSTAAR